MRGGSQRRRPGCRPSRRKAAAPVEYVRVCSTYGEGFFYIPGTETCLRIGGRVRADYLYRRTVHAHQDITGFRARGRLNIDHRTMTAYGLLRAYIRYEIDRNSGVFASPGGISTNPKINQALSSSAASRPAASRRSSRDSESAGAELRRPALRRSHQRRRDSARLYLLLRQWLLGHPVARGWRSSAASTTSSTFRCSASAPAVAPLPFTYGGQRMPDVVANLRYTGSWGSAQLSGALHQIRDVAAGLTTVDGVLVPVINPITGLPNPTFADTDYGFAVALNGYVNLPFLGAGDTAWISATYTDGAVGYINAGQAGPIGHRRGQWRHRRRSARAALRGRLCRSVHGRVQDQQGLWHRRRPQS